MNFKEWCAKVYGITNFSEGKIINRVFLPARALSSIRFDPLIYQFGGYLAKNIEGKDGLILTKECFEQIIQTLRFRYSHGFRMPIDESAFQAWVDTYFESMGIDSSKKNQEYRDLPNIHIGLPDPHLEMQFMQHFQAFYPRHSIDVLTGQKTVEMPPFFLGELYRMYYQSADATIHYATDPAVLQAHRSDMQDLLHRIEKEDQISLLNKAHILALDYSNNDKTLDISLGLSEACSAYSFSLYSYAHLNHDNLTPYQYQSLLYAARMLESIDAEDKLTQGLSSDALFVESLKNFYWKSETKGGDEHHQSHGRTLIEDLPDKVRDKIQRKIKTNVFHVLYGSSPQDEKLGSILRFIPDHQMQSDTDVLIMQGGGMAMHSANFRIIKVGMLANGQRAGLSEKPHHYEYFKVENNLGAGCHEIDYLTKTCAGTYVTKLEPFGFSRDGTPYGAPIDPYKHPVEYQKQMEETLRELITTERKLLLYRRPITGPNNEMQSPPGSKEAIEWTRLNKIKTQLSGVPYPYPVTYFAHDPSNPSVRFACGVQTQRGYMQEGGSCPIFSIKSLVTSICGSELATMHSDYLQRHDGNGHMISLQSRIKDLEMRIKALGGVVPRPTEEKQQPSAGQEQKEKKPAKVKRKKEDSTISRMLDSIDSAESLGKALSKLSVKNWQSLFIQGKDTIVALIGDDLEEFLDRLKLPSGYYLEILDIIQSTDLLEREKGFDAIDYSTAVQLFRIHRMDYYEILNYTIVKLAAHYQCSPTELCLQFVDADSSIESLSEIAAGFSAIQKDSNEAKEFMLLIEQVMSVLENPEKKKGYDQHVQDISEQVVDKKLQSLENPTIEMPELLRQWAAAMSSDRPENNYWTGIFNAIREKLCELISEHGLDRILKVLEVSADYHVQLIAEIGAIHLLEKVPIENRGKLLRNQAFVEALSDTMQSDSGKIRIFHLPRDWFSQEEDKQLAQQIIAVANIRNLITRYQASLDQPSTVLSEMLKLLDTTQSDNYESVLDKIDSQLKKTNVRAVFTDKQQDGKHVLSALDTVMRQLNPEMMMSHRIFTNKDKSKIPTEAKHHADEPKEHKPPKR